MNLSRYARLMAFGVLAAAALGADCSRTDVPECPPTGSCAPPGTDPDPPAVDVTVAMVRTGLPCVEVGEELEFAVFVRNDGVAPAEGITLHDTLSSPEAFQGPLDAGDVVVDRERFPDAEVELNPDGLSFVVRPGRLLPTGGEWVPVYTVSLPSATTQAIWCNGVTASSVENAPLATSTGCVTQTLALSFPKEFEDGILSPNGSFDGSPETFKVGQELAYRIRIRNDNCQTFGGSEVVVANNPAWVVSYRDPVAGFPTRGIVEETRSDRVVWKIGDFPPQESVTLVIRAEASAAGEVVAGLSFTTEDPRIQVQGSTTTRVEP